MISLIITVKNERANLPQWLSSIHAQTVQPDEIVIVDGCSSDDTWAWLQSVASTQVRIFQKSGNIAQGRNYAIEQARGEIIVVADAGCYYEPTWLEKITAPIVGHTTEFSATAFGPWLESSDALLTYLLAAATTPAPTEFTREWLPSSRSVAFTKSVWHAVGGYPAWIPFGEDVIFDLKIKKRGIVLHAINKVLVRWRPRPSLPAYLKQLFNYTRSDGHGKLWYGRQATRFVVYGGLSLGIYLSIASSPWWLLLIVIAGVFYLKKFWQRLAIFGVKLPVLSRLVGFLVLPLIIALGDIAKMAGWLVGVVQRWTGAINYQPW